MIFRITTRMVSHPIYEVEADSEQEARRVIEEEGGLDPVDERVNSEYIIGVEDITPPGED